MATVSAVLQQYGIDEQEYAQYLSEELAAVAKHVDLPLSGGELEFLRAHGGSEANEILAEWTPERDATLRADISAKSVAHLLSATATPAAIAGLVRKSRTQVTRDLNRRALYGLRVGSRWRVPLWQIVARAYLPGLETVVPAIPAELHPTAIERFMSIPQEELDGRSPVEFLTGGGRPERVAAMVRDLDRTW